jgi:hypothetical protein
MNSDPKRKSGFYWVRFEGKPCVAEYDRDSAFWEVPGGRVWFMDLEVCELLSGRLEPPALPETSKSKRKKAAKPL